MRRPLASLLAIAALTTSLAACGSDGSESAASTPTSTAPVAASDYVKGLCTSVADFRDTLDARNAAFQEEFSTGSPTPAEVKDGLVAFLGDAAAETQALTDEIRALGTPDVEGGEEMVLGFVSALEQAEDLFATTQDEIEALPTDDPAALTQGFEEAGAKLTDAATQIGATFDDLENAELTAAAKDEPACADIL